MATLFCFALILAIIVSICRYNENEKLFWPLTLSFLGAFAIATAVTKIVEHKESNAAVVKVAPTQVLQSMPCNFYSLADISLAATMREKSPKPVSKDSTLTTTDVTLSEVHVAARGQPFWIGYFDTS